MSDLPVNQSALPHSREREKQRLQRLVELRHDLHRGHPSRRDYARDTLLALLWVEEGRARLSILCALCDYSPETGQAEAPILVGRLAARLNRNASTEDLPPPPVPAQLHAWAERSVAAVLVETLDRLKAASLAAETPPAFVQQEAALCLESLTLARLLAAESSAESCVRLLRLFPAVPPRIPLIPIRLMNDLREAACSVLGTLSPDVLFSLWTALGGPEVALRQDLLPALDYLTDARALPYLSRLLERRTQWTDGELVGWFVVRAFERIGDRRALPALRKIAARSGALRSLLPALRSLERAEAGTSPELAREALRVLQAIETGEKKKERNILLRPAQKPARDLLRPVAETPPDRAAADSLLRPDDSGDRNP